MEKQKCPIPSHILTKNCKNYAQRYAIPIRDTDMPFLGDWKYTQSEVTGSKDPVFSYELPSEGKRKFATCNNIAMIRYVLSSQKRHMYWMIETEDPVNFFVDFDITYAQLSKELATNTSVNAAISELLTCLDLVLSTLDGKDNFVADYTVSRLDGNRPGKESCHLVFHFGGGRVMNSYVDCRNLYDMIVSASLKRMPKDKNPLFLYNSVDKVHVCIADVQVYSRNRNWRMIGCAKNKGPDKKPEGFLYPPCEYCRQTGNLICDDSDCSYHAKGLFSISEWCENNPIFIPLDENGKTVVPIKLHLAPVDNLGHIQKKLKLSQKSGCEVAASISSIPIHISCRQLSSLGASLCSRLTGSACAARGSLMQWRILIQSDNKHCPYKYAIANKKGGVGETLEHQSNHVYYIMDIAYPLPVFHVRCTDDNCQRHYAKKEHTKNMHMTLPVDLLTADEKLKYSNACYDYMMSQDVSTDIFKAKEKTNDKQKGAINI